MHSILLVEDEAVIRSSLKQYLEKQQYKVIEAASVEEAICHNLYDFSLIITDIRLPGSAGTEIIPLAGDVPVLVMTSYASMRSAIDTMKKGAADYIAKPFNYEEILETIKQLIKPRAPEPSTALIKGMIGGCHSMQLLFDQIARVAPTDSHVLIEGESGTGKESVARALHQLSARAGREPVIVNCASTPDEELERELFGFTNSDQKSEKIGLVEAASDSTLFLDEIGELSPSLQARLVSILQDGQVKRFGSSTKRKVNLRLLVSTSQSLKKLIALGRFREDLYYRLNVVKIYLPPLRERKDDLRDLAGSFLEHLGKKFNKSDIQFSDETLSILLSYSWPGNIRELQNAIEGAVILSDGSEILPRHLSVDIREPNENCIGADTRIDLSLEEYFLRFVQENQNNMTETQLARNLGISRKSLWEKRQKLNIPRVKSRSK